MVDVFANVCLASNLMARDEMKNLGYAAFDAPKLESGDGRGAVDAAAAAVGVSASNGKAG